MTDGTDHKLNEWRSRWKDQDLPWAGPSADKALFDHYREILTRYGLNQSCEVFVPLCGDSCSVRFFYEQGHRVTALEFVPEALEQLVRQFFPVHSGDLRLEREEVLSLDRLKLLKQDIFDFESKPRFDLIYDRAALIAVHPE